MVDEQVANKIGRLAEHVNSDTYLVRRGRFFSGVFLVGAGSIPIHITVNRGAIEDVSVGAAIMRSWRFAIRAESDSWLRFWQPVPEPGYHDLLALTRFGRASIEGDLQPFMANLRYFKEVLEKPRHENEGAVS
jgi:hypothetical protein